MRSPTRLLIVSTLLALPLAACSRGDAPSPIVTPERPKDAGVKKDTRPPGPSGSGGSTGTPTTPGTGAAEPDASAIDATAASDASSEVSSGQGGSEVGSEVATRDDGGAGDVGPITAPNGEAMWSHTMCNKATLMFPKIDKNNGVFPIGSCPPPETLNRACGGNSKIKVMKATAQTWETGYVHPPEYAIDEYLMTRWSSNTMPTSWIQLDFGSEQTFSRIYLAWELAHGSDYDLVTSNDGTTWTMLKQVRGGNGYQDIVDVEGKARYLRLNGVKRGVIGEGPYGYSLFDFTICGQRP